MKPLSAGLGLTLLLTTAGASPGLAARTPEPPPRPELTVQSEYQFVTEPLTTERVSLLDPDQLYPHRQRWLVSRRVELTGLKAHPKTLKANTPYGVHADGLISIAQGSIKGPGPWYQALQDFNCKTRPNSDLFETPEGAQRSAAAAGNDWGELLEREKFKLGFLLKRVSEKTEAAALDQGHRIFKKWLEGLYPLWRAEVEQKGRLETWSYYHAEASAQNICPRKSAQPPSPKWKSMMEPPAASPPPILRILARAPARLWDGFYSVRVSLGAAGKILNGRFLIDPGAQQSIISPEWLESQGVFPLWVIAPKEPLARVTWSGPWEGKGALAPIAILDSSSVSGLSLPLSRFILKDTVFFEPPDFISSCCDGILGLDFLRLFPMEFQTSQTPQTPQTLTASGSPAGVKIWPIENFRGPLQSQWLEWGEIPARDLPAKGNFTYDLPHGRIWLPPSKGGTRVSETNRSGLELEYDFQGGERVLRVQRILPRSPAARQLVQAGLKVGSQMTAIDSKPVEEMDITEVKQRLAGYFGDSVSLQWKSGKRLKMAPFRVK